LKRIGVLVSGGGTNLQAIIGAVKNGEIPAEIGVVISNKAGVYALERATQNQISTRVIDHREFFSVIDFTKAILNCLREFQIDYVCLAGFLRIIDGLFMEAYPNRILNIHPALLPAFGGKGMYGHHVHEAVIASGAKYSGATVHLVTAEADVGPIVAQGIVAVDDNDTPDSLAAKVLQVEHQLYPQAIRMLIEGKLVIEGLRVRTKL
jgi:phosphoribosylglycinamide formyltransferase-1